MAPRRAKLGAKTARDGAKTMHDGAKMAQDGPRWPQDGPRWQDYPLGRAERRQGVPSRPRKCDRIAINREMRENRERGREEDQMFSDVLNFSALPVHC